MLENYSGFKEYFYQINKLVASRIPTQQILA